MTLKGPGNSASLVEEQEGMVRVKRAAVGRGPMKKARSRRPRRGGRPNEGRRGGRPNEGRRGGRPNEGRRFNGPLRAARDARKRRRN